MDEHAIVQALIDQVEAEARARGASAVHKLWMRVGARSGVEPRVLTAAYDSARDSTMCEHAPLDLQVIPARWVCPVCGSPVRRGDVLNCARCEVPARLAEGNEILLNRIELEMPV